MQYEPLVQEFPKNTTQKSISNVNIQPTLIVPKRNRHARQKTQNYSTQCHTSSNSNISL